MLIRRRIKLRKIFTAEDLKTGMIVVNAEGEKGKVMNGTSNGDVIVWEGGTWGDLSYYLKDMTHKNHQ